MEGRGWVGVGVGERIGLMTGEEGGREEVGSFSTDLSCFSGPMV